VNMKHKKRLDTLADELKPARRIFQIEFVADEEEAARISKERNYPPWQPGDGIRFIIDESLADWRRDYAELQNAT